jgi:hypothetical protein
MDWKGGQDLFCLVNNVIVSIKKGGDALWKVFLSAPLLLQ